MFWLAAVLKALSPSADIGQRMKNELRLIHKKRMTLTKEKNDTCKQRTFMMSVHSKDQTGMKRIFDAKKMTFVPYT